MSGSLYLANGFANTALLFSTWGHGLIIGPLACSVFPIMTINDFFKKT